MIKQAEFIKAWAVQEGFNFVDVDEVCIKLPCSLDRGYKEDNHTIFIKGFYPGSKKIGVSYGGLKNIMTLNEAIDLWPSDLVAKYCIPRQFICARCNEKNLNLRTDDNHQTYVCPRCHTE